MSIKIKILIPMILFTVISGMAVIISDIFQFSDYVYNSMDESVGMAATVAAGELENIKARAYTASLYFASDPGIIRAMEDGDLDALLARSSQMYAESGVDFCTIADASGTALVRPHKPESKGDDVTAMPSVQSALNGKTLTTIEQGTSVRVSACSGSPIYDSRDNLIGVVSVGFRLDTNAFVDSVKSLVKSEVTIFVGDERVSTTVLKEDGLRATGTKAETHISQKVLSGNIYHGQAKILGRDALTDYRPITGADGKVVGMLFVGRYLDEKENTVAAFVRGGMLIMLVLLAIAVPVILAVARHIILPVKSMVHAARALAAGDTEIEIKTGTKDEMGELAAAFNDMAENTRKQIQTITAIAEGNLTVSVTARSGKDSMNNALKAMISLNREVLSQIVDTAEQVSSGARQIAEGSESLAQGATEQAASIEQLLGTIDAVDNNVKDNASRAGEAAALSNMISANAEKGSEQMARMVQAVREINESSQSIGDIIKAIDDIAFQTNILALNAAVEAARAGHHGKGFAVVADEVRNLAAKSAEAAKSTASLIEASIAKAELGAQIADETALFLGEIVSGITESGQLVNEIASASGEQSMSIAKMNEDIRQVSQVIQGNSAAAEQSAAASEQLSAQAYIFEELVSQFKLK